MCICSLALICLVGCELLLEGTLEVSVVHISTRDSESS
jgi:hypothetical protein